VAAGIAGRILPRASAASSAVDILFEYLVAVLLTRGFVGVPPQPLTPPGDIE
jgi:hypothetical protein